MIMNRYNYLNPSVQDPNGKKDALKATESQSKHYKQKAKMTASFLKMDKRLLKRKKNHQDIHAKTYSDRNSKPQQKHRLGTVRKILLGYLN